MARPCPSHFSPHFSCHTFAWPSSGISPSFRTCAHTAPSPIGQHASMRPHGDLPLVSAHLCSPPMPLGCRSSIPLSQSCRSYSHSSGHTVTQTHRHTVAQSHGPRTAH
eukprot:2393201-Pyramimonas_sp.AAC.1